MNRKNVGATREAVQTLSPLNQRLHHPTRLLVRYSGYFLLAFVIYLAVLFSETSSVEAEVYAWGISYLLYLVFLEIVRRWKTDLYDTRSFRVFRVAANLVFLTWLLTVMPHSQDILSFFYWIPIFAAIAYFSESTLFIWIVNLLAVLGLFLSTMVFAEPPTFSHLQFTLVALLLLGGSVFFRYIYAKAIQVPINIPKVGEKLHTILNIHDLILEVAKTCEKITAANQIIIIVVDPESGRYLGHYLKGVELRPGKSIEDVAKRCHVLKTGESFESPDMFAEAFSRPTVYEEFLTQAPRSIVVEPIFTKDNKIIGIVSLSSDLRNYFSPNVIYMFREFMHIANGSIENSITHRVIQLSKAREISQGDTFTEYMSEDEIYSKLSKKACELSTDELNCEIHRYLPNSEQLESVHIAMPDQITRIAENNLPGNNKMRYGLGVIGTAIEIKEPILVPNTNDHPWIDGSLQTQPYQSLLVAPLIDPIHKNQPIGTISLYANKPNAFNLQDEISLYTLACETAQEITRNRSYKAYRDQGGTFKQIFDAFRPFDVEVDEDILCKKIVQAAVKVLDFEIARIRIYDPSTHDLISREIEGVAMEISIKLQGERLPKSEIDQFLVDKYQVGGSYQVPHDDPDWRQIVDKYFYITPESSQKVTGWLSYDALLTPLTNLDGEFIGLLSFDHPRSGRPTIKEIEEVDIFSLVAAWVLERADNRRGLLEKQQRTAAFINSISELVTDGGDIDSLGNTVVQVGANLLSAEGCTLHIVEGTNVVLKYSNYLKGPEFIGTSKLISDEEGCGLTSYVAARGEIIRANNIEFKQHEAWAGETKHISHLQSKKCFSLLKVPIYSEDKQIVVGVLTLENKKRYGRLVPFDEKDEKDLCLLADEVAIALKISNRYQDFRKWERIGLEDDLHDLINWYHSGVCLFIDASKDWLEKGEYEKGIELLNEVQNRAYTTVWELKTLHSALTRKYLEKEDFSLALNLMVASWAERLGKRIEDFPVKVKCQQGIRIPTPIKNILLRIASNAFTNCIRHSGVTKGEGIHIWISAERIGNKITMAIEDNGHGMDKIECGFGIQRMEQLTALLNRNELVQLATLNIDSREQSGTEVQVNVLLRQ